MDQYESAQQEFHKAYDVLSVSLGADHDRTLQVAEKLASVYEAAGETDEAAEWRTRMFEADGAQPSVP
jgi:lipopolysaccharide biosynthesis regulator YciM